MFRRSLSVHRSLSTGPAKPPETRRERIVSENWLKQSVAEAIGTFALIFVGVLSISAAGIVGAPGGLATLASIGLAPGLTIAGMGGGPGAISGGHFNPAVTFGFVITGRMKPATGGMYWIAQLVGASAAGLLIAALFGGGPVAGGPPDPRRGGGGGGGPPGGGRRTPARTFGPALASGHWNNHLVYWIGPLIGGALAAAVEHFYLMERKPARRR